MPRIVLAVLLSLAATASYAQRPATQAMSCSQAQSLVAHRGAVVLSTGRHTYDRFVKSRYYCATGEWAYTGVAPTRDTGSCTLGYVCKSAPPLWHDRRDGFLNRF